MTSSIGFNWGVRYCTVSGFCLPATYRGMDSIGPGRYSDIAAMMSSKLDGFIWVRNWVMPEDSSWKMPVVSPSEIIW